MLAALTKQSIRLIRAGAEDERIYKEYKQSLKKGKEKAAWFSKIIAVLFPIVIFTVFGFTVFMQVIQDKQTGGIPSLRVVYSDSMSDKYEKNQYLFDNNLNNQFNRFDIVITYELPKEEDLKLYDIVVYEVEGVLLIHRIVGVEEPNDQHAERYFLLQGDLVASPDKFPVRYSQMKAIYRGEHIPFVGSFVMFLQSPAGYMCMILIAIEMFTSPLIEKKLTKEEKERLAHLLSGKKNRTDMEKAVRMPPICLVPVPRPVPVATAIPEAEIIDAEVL